MVGAPIPEHERTKKLLEEILGPLPPAGSVEFGRYLLELAAHDPRVVPIISQAVLKGELPSEDQLALLRQVGEKIRGASALAQGGGGRVGVSQGGRTQGPEERLRKPEGPSSALPSDSRVEDVPPVSKPLARGEASAEPRPSSSGEAFGAPSPQQAKGEEGGGGTRKSGEEGREERRSGYKAYEKHIRGKQRAERGLQRLLKQFEPNLRTFVLHPRKVLLWVLVPVLLVGTYWVFEQPIKAQMAKLRQAAEGQAGPPPPPPQGGPPSQDNDLPPPPPPPQEAEGDSPQESATSPSATSPSSEVEPATASAPQGETGPRNGATQGQGPQAEGGVAQPPVPPPPPALPVYGEVPPPPPSGGQQVSSAEGGQESPSPVVKAFENSATPLVKALGGVGGEGGQGGQAGSLLRGGQGETPKVVSLVGGGGGQGQSAPAGDQLAQASGSYLVRKDADPEARGVLIRRFADAPFQKRSPEEPQGVAGEGALSEAPSSPAPTTSQRGGAGGQSLPSGALAPSPSSSQPPASGQEGGALPLPESLRGVAGGSASAPTASFAPPPSQVQEGQGGGRQGAQRGDGGVPSGPPALGLRYGQILWGEVVAGVAMAEGMTEAPLLIRLKNEGEEYLAFGGATLNVRTNRIFARIDRIYYKDVAYLVSGYVVDETGTLGIKADVREEAPNAAVNLLRGVFGGIKQYVDYYAKATTTTVIPGTGVVTSSAPPPLGLTILGTALGQFAAPPDQISVVRVWVVNPGKKAGLVIVPPQP